MKCSSSSFVYTSMILIILAHYSQQYSHQRKLRGTPQQTRIIPSRFGKRNYEYATTSDKRTWLYSKGSIARNFDTRLLEALVKNKEDNLYNNVPYFTTKNGLSCIHGWRIGLKCYRLKKDVSTKTRTSKSNGNKVLSKLFNLYL